MKRIRPSTARQAFTLVELLTVIGIIAILAAIIFPAISAMLRRSYQTTSINNLRQWYNAFGASVTNHDQEVPLPGVPFDKDNPDAWYNRLPVEMNERAFNKFTTDTQPDYGKKSVWVNPIVPKKDWSTAGFIFNYGFNDSLVEHRDATEGDRALRMPTLQSLPTTILMGEKADSTPNLNVTNIKAYYSSNDAKNDQDGKANLLFCDGHVDSVKRSVFADTKATSATSMDDRTAVVSWLPYGSSNSRE